VDARVVIGAGTVIELVDLLKEASRRLERFDRPELNPGFSQAQHHLDRALHWAEEMLWILEQEKAT
jgi:hypothetical protein